ncbi:arsenate reductase (glutaredoxin) [Thiomicrorhabdus sp. Milos-T2]|uniref:arsenate reductase (glutaredoxin) n=1 Tax=Thiomicrorhabdus sp. Milos-T2 TaxID=90814 RepID=UPI0004944380|nr:arsenate reductase (glutaredoxin) [Thiomicrorhabdus sp. Milos-T2]
MKSATIYHNPRCSKSRNTLKILNENNININEVRYLENPPSKSELAELCELMKVKPFDIIRTGEALFSELGLTKKDSRSDDEWLDILAANPKLIERPIVRIEDKAVMGRPPENVLDIL